jgi:serine/threonine protein kinase
LANTLGDSRSLQAVFKQSSSAPDFKHTEDTHRDFKHTEDARTEDKRMMDFLLTPPLATVVTDATPSPGSKVALGGGSYGSVRKGIDKSRGCAVAVKRFHRTVPWMSSLQEIKALSQLGHEHVVGLRGVAREADGSTSMVLDYSGRALRSLKMPTTDGVAKRLITQLVKAVAHIHRTGWTHLDIHPGNILVSDDGRLKLADFGLATGTEAQTNRNVIAAWYRPPEIARMESYMPAAADMWSVGCVLAELLFGGPAFRCSCSDDVKLARLHDQFREDPLKYVVWVYGSDAVRRAPESALKLTMRMLEYEPAQRVTAEQVLDAEWLAAEPASTTNERQQLHKQGGARRAMLPPRAPKMSNAGHDLKRQRIC